MNRNMIIMRHGGLRALGSYCFIGSVPTWRTSAGFGLCSLSLWFVHSGDLNHRKGKQLEAGFLKTVK